ncbi:MAG: hypothetical protein RJA63_2626 [Pseudomonadota bacterium]|jgi:hypothetical protein
MTEAVDQPYLSIDLREQGGPISWRTDQELLSWLRQILEDWRWLNSCGVAAGQNAHQAIYNYVQAFQQTVQNAINNAQQNPAYAQGQLADLRQRMESLFKPNNWLIRKSAQAEFINKLKEEGKERIAARIVGLWLGQDISGSPFQDAVASVLELEFFQRGFQDRSKIERVALKKLAEEYGSRLSELHSFEKEMIERFRLLDEQSVMQSLAQQTAFDIAQEERATTWQVAISDQKSGWDSELENAKKRLETLEETYRAYMTLEAPVLYWKAKAKRHFKWAVGSGIAVVLSMIAVGCLLYWQLREVGGAVKRNAVLADAAAQAAKSSAATPVPVDVLPSTWHFDVAILVLLGTLSFWFIRLLVRVFLSHLHLENDAAERVTMAETYLALSSGDKLPEGEDLRTVLAALFRPSGDGIVKDEGVPPSLVDFLTKLNR